MLRWSSNNSARQVREQIARDLEALKLRYQEMAKASGAGEEVGQLTDVVLDDAISVVRTGKRGAS